MNPIIGIINFSVLSKRDKGSWISSRECEWEIHVESIMSPARLDFRINLLEFGIIEQIKSQTLPPSNTWFELHIISSTLLPEKYKEKLNSLASLYNWLKIIYRTPDEPRGINQLVEESIIERFLDSFEVEKLPYATFRLDDDDLISIDFLRILSAHNNFTNAGKIITFPNGIKILWDHNLEKIINIESTRKEFIAIGLSYIGLAEKSTRKIISDDKSIFNGKNHYSLSAANNIIIDNSEMIFAWSQHSTQDTAGRFKTDYLNSSWQAIPKNIELIEQKFPSVMRNFSMLYPNTDNLP